MSTKKSLQAVDASSGIRPPVALIAGPTASGKSACAVSLAQMLARRGIDSVVINADSAQVYADLQILSARPAIDEMAGVTHRLFGSWDGGLACSAADWAAQARTEIAAAHAQGAVPILVGGTGLYLQTLLYGIAPIPSIDPAIRAAVRGLPVADAYAALRDEDPDRATKLAPTDTARVIRALEVIRSTGQPLSVWQREPHGGLDAEVTLYPLVLLPPRDWLYERCNRRFAAMLECGAITEVAALLKRKLDPVLPVMRAIGVPEITALLEGRADFADTLACGAQATRNYAKRQFTWFRNQSPADWPRAADIDCQLNDVFASLLR